MFWRALLRETSSPKAITGVVCETYLLSGMRGKPLSTILFVLDTVLVGDMVVMLVKKLARITIDVKLADKVTIATQDRT